MIHIIPAKNNKFAVAITAKNGELLHRSQNLPSKQKCWQNIRATQDEYNTIGSYVQDDTLKTPVVYYFERGVKWIDDKKPVAKYVPGRNRKKKS